MAAQALVVATLGGASLDRFTRKTLCAPTQRRGSSWRINAKFSLPPLPYKPDALEPYISKRTLENHWENHQRGYIDTLNKHIENTALEGYLLEDIVKKTYNKGKPQPAFNSAAEVWNHDFFFSSMKPGGGKAPEGEIAELIDKDFGSYESFLKEFKLAAASQFGPGWVWLALDDAKLVVEKSPNAINPLIWNHIPLLAVDIWEHAYFMDFEDRRADYVDIFFKELVNWEIVNARLDRGRAFTNWSESETTLDSILREAYRTIPQKSGRSAP